MSGRDKLLDKAIAEAKEREDWQLVEWLRMARGGESAARWYSDKLREAHRAERKLLNENAKLRELVRILNNCADECGDCDTCPINGESGVLNPWLGCDSLRDRMAELGVEP